MVIMSYDKIKKHMMTKNLVNCHILEFATPHILFAKPHKYVYATYWPCRALSQVSNTYRTCTLISSSRKLISSPRNMEVYSKKITKTDARVRLSVSTESLDNHFFQLAAGEQSREFVAVDADDEGQCWRLHLSIRSNGYRKPVIIGGWMKFVRDKNVQIGDAVRVSKEYYYDQATATQMMRYRVRVTREIQILGVWHVAVVP